MTKDDSYDSLLTALKRHDGYLKEALEAIEKRDMSPDDIREFLKFAEKNIKSMRRLNINPEARA